MEGGDNLVEDSFNYPVLKHGKLVIDLKCRRVTIDDKKIDLSTREFNLLYFLVKHPGWVFTYDELYDEDRGRIRPVGAEIQNRAG